jgi:hypothetical protein
VLAAYAISDEAPHAHRDILLDVVA